MARENLDAGASLVATAALMIDFVLNVAVGISAGVGVARLVAGAAEPVVTPPHPGAAVEAASLWLLLRAFAAGCTAMTGVEAESNGVDAFREPVVREAHRTLTATCMVVRWRREGRCHWQRLAMIGLGAWTVALAIDGAFRVEQTGSPTVVVACERRDAATDHALRFAMTLSPDVVAMHLLHLAGPGQEEDLRAIKTAFERNVAAPIAASRANPPRHVALPAPYHIIEEPVLTHIGRIDADTPGRSVAILIAALVVRHRWQRLLHGRRAAPLRSALLEHAGPRLMVITAPCRHRGGR